MASCEVVTRDVMQGWEIPVKLQGQREAFVEFGRTVGGSDHIRRFSHHSLSLVLTVRDNMNLSLSRNFKR